MKKILEASVLATALLALAGVAFADDHKAHDGHKAGESAQPVDDTWITTKVKSSLLAEKDVSGLKLEVETVNGVVHLRGNATSKAEVDRAKTVATGIEGVKSVDTTGIMVGADR